MDRIDQRLQLKKPMKILWSSFSKSWLIWGKAGDFPACAVKIVSGIPLMTCQRLVETTLKSNTICSIGVKKSQWKDISDR